MTLDAVDLLHDLAPHSNGLLGDVLRGLRRPRKELPCKYFYDERGSELFERICELEEYYPTRTEIAIMERAAGEMADAIGAHCLLIEYGSGNSLKTRILLDHLHQPAAYVPIDISRAQLLRSAGAIARSYPQLKVLPVCADFTQPFALDGLAGRRVVYFPGSTIGNFDHAAARVFLAGIAERCGRAGGLLIGVDLDKDRETLERAYDDAKGVTAEFNLNLLRRINREIGADFELEGFRHRALYDPRRRCVDLYLVSLREQCVRIGGETVGFERGEAVHTESSYKYTLDGFDALARSAGLAVQQVWTDSRSRFSVQFLVSAN